MWACGGRREGGDHGGLGIDVRWTGSGRMECSVAVRRAQQRLRHGSLPQ